MSELRARRGASASSSSQDGEIARLEALKRDAAAREDYVEANRLKDHINSLKASAAAGSGDGAEALDDDARMRRAQGSSSAWSAIDAEDEKRRDKLEKTKEEALEEMREMLKKKDEVKQGLSNKTKEAKDRLAEEPYNLQLVFELGIAYAEDEQWAQSANALMRGWKRMSEIPDPLARFEFLVRLCEASHQSGKARQALAVLDTIEVPDDRADLRVYSILATQVYGTNGDMQKSLQAFHKAIEDEPFDIVFEVWIATHICIRKVDAWAAARTALDSRFPEEVCRIKLDALEKLQEVKDQIEHTQQKPKTILREFPRFFIGAGVLVMIAFLYILYLLESKSLQTMPKIRK